MQLSPDILIFVILTKLTFISIQNKVYDNINGSKEMLYPFYSRFQPSYYEENGD